MTKLYYTIGEVAELLGESTSGVRFWSNYFSRLVSPKRNAKGNRLYTEVDIETFKQIQLLVRKNGMTLEGALARMTSDRKSVEDRVKAIDSLKRIREQLVAVKASL